MKRQMKGSFHLHNYFHLLFFVFCRKGKSSLFSLTFSYFGPHEEEITLVYVNANTGNAYDTNTPINHHAQRNLTRDALTI